MVHLYVDGQDSDFPESNEELSQQVAKLKSEVAENAKRIAMLKGTVDELASAVAQREMCGR